VASPLFWWTDGQASICMSSARDKLDGCCDTINFLTEFVSRLHSNRNKSGPSDAKRRRRERANTSFETVDFLSVLFKATHWNRNY
jgi:hypothetical protein